MQQHLYLGRQPIMDQWYEVIAYELLYQAEGASQQDADGLAAQGLVAGLVDIGLDKISGHKPVFINLPASLLQGDVPALLPADKVGIEIGQNIKLDQTIVEACKALKQQGFTLLLDGYRHNPDVESILELVDYVKINFQSGEDMAEQLSVIRRYPVKLLAKKVETLEEHNRAKALGIHYYQGYFFCKPERMENETLPDSKLAILRALQQVMEAEAIEDIEDVIKQDINLSYRLLKYINSAAFGMRREIESVQQALSLLGLNNIRRWLSILALASLGEHKPLELVRMAMLRGKILDGVANSMKESRSSDYFILGMFSLLDALLDQSMDQALSNIALPSDIREGLLVEGSQLGLLLDMIRSLEKGEWAKVDAYCKKNSLSCEDISSIYTEAVRWTDEFAAQL
ncbi:MAG: EAL and HDOD domain-containing protein [Mariprofundaceae bacterium]